MEDVKVQGHSDLVRDPMTNAIINTNKSGYEEYISRRNIKKSETQKVQNLEDVNSFSNFYFAFSG